ncbi:MAG: aldehyde-activating protein [Pseudomonadota bacterium]
MISETASCYCGNISALVTLSRSLAEFQSRCCDCGFCTKHGAAYLSDSAGSLEIVICDADSTVGYRQGSGAAEFWVCGACGVLVAVTHDQGSKLLGAVNARALSNYHSVTKQQVVSPKTLNRDGKTTRWGEIWFQDVTITVGRRKIFGR